MEREMPPSEIQALDHIWAEDVGLWVRVRQDYVGKEDTNG